VFLLLGPCLFRLALQGVRATACRRWDTADGPDPATTCCRHRHELSLRLHDRTPVAAKRSPPKKKTKKNPSPPVMVDALAEVFGSGAVGVLADLGHPLLAGGSPSPICSRRARLGALPLVIQIPRGVVDSLACRAATASQTTACGEELRPAQRRPGQEKPPGSGGAADVPAGRSTNAQRFSGHHRCLPPRRWEARFFYDSSISAFSGNGALTAVAVVLALRWLDWYHGCDGALGNPHHLHCLFLPASCLIPLRQLRNAFNPDPGRSHRPVERIGRGSSKNRLKGSGEPCPRVPKAQPGCRPFRPGAAPAAAEGDSSTNVSVCLPPPI